MRIGERLVSEGLITLEMLDEGLRAQIVYGARLGTNLVELLHIELDPLSEALGRHHRLPAALAQHFERADPAVQARLSPRLAARWRAVPLGESPSDPTRIVVASTDPLPPAAQEEIRAALGAGVIPAVAPELRIHYHLERAFGIRRDNRFLRPPPPHTDDAPAPDERRSYVRTLSESDEVRAPEPLAKIAIQQVAVPADDPPGSELRSLPEALKAIRRATGRDSVAEVAVAALREGFDEAVEAAAIFVIRKSVALGWRGFCRSRDDDIISRIAVPLTEPSTLATAHHSGPLCGAPPAGSDLDHRLWNALGSPAPASIAVVPVEINGRTACLLHAQSASPEALGPIGGHRVSELGLALSAAFDRLIRAAER